MSENIDKMAKARAAKKPPTYKNVHEDVKALDDDHYLSLKNVKEWEKHNKERVKELRPLVRKASGKEERELRREITNRETFLTNIKTYLDSGVWLNLFYGENQEHKMRWKTIVPAYDDEGFIKTENWREMANYETITD